jgi:hypothetical protein
LIGKEAPVHTHPLLSDEAPLLVRPTLACVLAHAGLTPGDRQALWTQQLDYWIQYHRKANHRRKHLRDGRWWVWNSLACWQAQFPFWTRSMLRRVISCSMEAGVTLAGHYCDAKYDRTLWYTIDYQRLDAIAHAWERSRPFAQVEQMDVPNLNKSICPNWANGSAQVEQIDVPKLSTPITETTKENSEKERQRVWSSACVELAMQFPNAAYARWVRPLRLASLAGRNGTRQATLLCPDEYAREWCQHRLDVRIRGALAGALDVQPDALEVSYVVGRGDAPLPWLEARS